MRNKYTLKHLVVLTVVALGVCISPQLGAEELRSPKINKQTGKELAFGVYIGPRYRRDHYRPHRGYRYWGPNKHWRHRHRGDYYRHYNYRPHHYHYRWYHDPYYYYR